MDKNKFKSQISLKGGPLLRKIGKLGYYNSEELNFLSSRLCFDKLNVKIVSIVSNYLTIVVKKKKKKFTIQLKYENAVNRTRSIDIRKNH